MQLSDFEMMKTESPNGVQAVLDFGKYYLSIVQNELSLGNDQGLYEIAVYQDGCYSADQIELPGITEKNNTIKGFLTENEVDNIIKKLYTLTKEIPTQV